MFYAIKESQYLALFKHKFLICDATAVAKVLLQIPVHM